MKNPGWELALLYNVLPGRAAEHCLTLPRCRLCRAARCSSSLIVITNTANTASCTALYCCTATGANFAAGSSKLENSFETGYEE